MKNQTEAGIRWKSLATESVSASSKALPKQVMETGSPCFNVCPAWSLLEGVLLSDPPRWPARFRWRRT